MMNKQNLAFLLLLIALVFFIFCKNNTKEIEIPKTFSIEGTIKGLENSNLYFRFPDKNSELGYRMDSILVTNGTFKFKDSIEGHHFVRFNTRGIKELIKSAPGDGYFPTPSAYLNVILYPGADIKVSGKISDFMNVYSSGGDAINNDLGALHKEIYSFMNESINYVVQSSFEEDTEHSKVLEKKADSVGQIVFNIKKDFIRNNPSSVAALYYLSDMMMRSELKAEDAINAFNNVDTSLTDISFYKDISYRVSAIKNTKEGRLTPEIKTTSTLDDTEFNLASYRGKYVMIDFWGIWCGPCVSEMPKVKEFREKYSGKLEVLGVNSGDKKERIIDFITKNEYAWQQIMDDRNSHVNNFVLRYNVNAFPTKFIIDPKGKIVKKYVGSGEEAFTLLEELFK